MNLPATDIQASLQTGFEGLHADGVPEMIDQLLDSARTQGASDLHIVPNETHLDVAWRIDGVLQHVGQLPRQIAANIVARFKVLAELLTYRTDVPQEGRIRSDDNSLDMRVSTFPTLFGEKTVVRLLQTSQNLSRIQHLGLTPTVGSKLINALGRRSGVLLVSGPAGSGKTTTLYACLRELAATSEQTPQQTMSLVSLEDPIESIVPGVAQSQINDAAGFDYAMGLRSLMRQDPEVIMVGEIRDRETAETVLQASLTGHLVLTTLHAGSGAEAVGRLCDMGIEPYLLRSGLIAILCQRLVRKLCGCSQPAPADSNSSTPAPPNRRVAVGCDTCHGTGYLGRNVIAEWLNPSEPDIANGILQQLDSRSLHAAALATGHVDLGAAARDAVNDGWTTPEEIVRVLGQTGASTLPENGPTTTPVQ
jgi:type II secretory ATPase GspE/PulE/Tfp pilus assembly ATPase PilB-like protein